MGLSVLDKVKSLKPKQEIVAQPQPQVSQVEESVTEVQEENV
jgi:hypothetical protein